MPKKARSVKLDLMIARFKEGMAERGLEEGSLKVSDGRGRPSKAGAAKFKCPGCGKEVGAPGLKAHITMTVCCKGDRDLYEFMQLKVFGDNPETRAFIEENFENKKGGRKLGGTNSVPSKKRASRPGASSAAAAGKQKAGSSKASKGPIHTMIESASPASVAAKKASLAAMAAAMAVGQKEAPSSTSGLFGKPKKSTGFDEDQDDAAFMLDDMGGDIDEDEEEEGLFAAGIGASASNASKSKSSGAKRGRKPTKGILSKRKSSKPSKSASGSASSSSSSSKQTGSPSRRFMEAGRKPKLKSRAGGGAAGSGTGSASSKVEEELGRAAGIPASDPRVSRYAPLESSHTAKSGLPVDYTPPQHMLWAARRALQRNASKAEGQPKSDAMGGQSTRAVKARPGASSSLSSSAAAAAAAAPSSNSSASGGTAAGAGIGSSAADQESKFDDSRHLLPLPFVQAGMHQDASHDGAGAAPPSQSLVAMPTDSFEDEDDGTGLLGGSFEAPSNKGGDAFFDSIPLVHAPELEELLGEEAPRNDSSAALRSVVAIAAPGCFPDPQMPEGDRVFSTTLSVATYRTTGGVRVLLPGSPLGDAADRATARAREQWSQFGGGRHSGSVTSAHEEKAGASSKESSAAAAALAAAAAAAGMRDDEDEDEADGVDGSDLIAPPAEMAPEAPARRLFRCFPYTSRPGVAAEQLAVAPMLGSAEDGGEDALRNMVLDDGMTEEGVDDEDAVNVGVTSGSGSRAVAMADGEEDEEDEDEDEDEDAGESKQKGKGKGKGKGKEGDGAWSFLTSSPSKGKGKGKAKGKAGAKSGSKRAPEPAYDKPTGCADPNSMQPLKGPDPEWEMLVGGPVIAMDTIRTKPPVQPPSRGPVAVSMESSIGHPGAMVAIYAHSEHKPTSHHVGIAAQYEAGIQLWSVPPGAPGALKVPEPGYRLDASAVQAPPMHQVATAGADPGQATAADSAASSKAAAGSGSGAAASAAVVAGGRPSSGASGGPTCEAILLHSGGPTWDLKWNPFVQPAPTGEQHDLDAHEEAMDGVGGVLAAVHGDGAVRVYAIPRLEELKQMRKSAAAAAQGWVSTDTRLETERIHADEKLAAAGNGKHWSAQAADDAPDGNPDLPAGLCLAPRTVLPAGMGMGRELGAVPTCCDWSPREPSRILVGCSDGTVLGYDIEMEGCGIDVALHGKGKNGAQCDGTESRLVDAAVFGVDTSRMSGLHPIAVQSAASSIEADGAEHSQPGGTASSVVFRVVLFPVQTYQVPFFAGEAFHHCAVRAVAHAPGSETGFSASYMSGDVIVWDEEDAEYLRGSLRSLPFSRCISYDSSGIALHMGVESGVLSTVLPGFDKAITRQWPSVLRGKQAATGPGKELKAFSTPMDIRCIRALPHQCGVLEGTSSFARSGASAPGVLLVGRADGEVVLLPSVHPNTLATLSSQGKTGTKLRRVDSRGINRQLIQLLHLWPAAPPITTEMHLDSVYPYLSQPPKKADPAHQVRNPQQPRMLYAASKVCGVHWVETDSSQARGQIERERQDLLGELEGNMDGDQTGQGDVAFGVAGRAGEDAALRDVASGRDARVDLVSFQHLTIVSGSYRGIVRVFRASLCAEKRGQYQHSNGLKECSPGDVAVPE